VAEVASVVAAVDFVAVAEVFVAEAASVAEAAAVVAADGADERRRMVERHSQEQRYET
jgi:hypothetical protein